MVSHRKYQVPVSIFPIMIKYTIKHQLTEGSKNLPLPAASFRHQFLNKKNKPWKQRPKNEAPKRKTHILRHQSKNLKIKTHILFIDIDKRSDQTHISFPPPIPQTQCPKELCNSEFCMKKLSPNLPPLMCFFTWASLHSNWKIFKGTSFYEK